MYCPNCGTEIPSNSSFCPKCGTQFIERFDRASFKQRAKMVLGRRYWYAFAVSLIEAIIVGGLDASYRYNNLFGHNAGTNFFLRPTLILALVSLVNAAWILSTAYRIFISNTIEVGSAKFFLNTRYGGGDIADIFYSFRGRHYLNIVGAMAWRLLFQFLWTLLFIVPGIVKYYSYCLVPYILSENPHIGYDRALKLSMEMTSGYKGEIFVLQLSFIGWYLLGALCLGVGVFFVHPYLKSTMAEMYVMLRDNAVKRGLCTYGELNL